MKKIINFILCICFTSTLISCANNLSYDLKHIEKVLENLSIESSITSNFDLITAYENVSIEYTSDNSAITIEGNKAVVSRKTTDVTVVIKAIAQRGDYQASKNFNVNVLKNTSLTQKNYVTIEDIFEMEIGKEVTLECVTVADSYSSGTHFTDGENVIYASVANLVKGDTYEVTGEITSYGTGVNASIQLKNVELTTLNNDSQIIEPIEKSIEYISTTTNFTYYTVTGEIKIISDSLFIVDSDYKLEISSYNLSSSLELLKCFENEEVTINAYVTGGYNNRTILTYTTQNNIISNDNAYVNAASQLLTLKTYTLENIDLPTTSFFNTNISWSSNNESILSNTGIINRQEESTTVTLTATISLNQFTTTKTIDVVVISSLHTANYELFISEYYEGKSYDKYIEIYNPCDHDIDLSNYTIKLGRNGAALGEDVNLTGILKSHETFVIATSHSSLHSDISTLITNLGSNGMFSSICIGITGDDSIGLFNNNVLVDMFGIEEDANIWLLDDGGTTQDYRLIRNPGIGANTTWDTSEWTSTQITSSPSYIDDLGKHTFFI